MSARSRRLTLLGSLWLSSLGVAEVARGEDRVRTYEVSESALGETSPTSTRVRTNEVRAPKADESAPSTDGSTPSAAPGSSCEAHGPIPTSSSTETAEVSTVVEPEPPGSIPPAPGAVPTAAPSAAPTTAPAAASSAAAPSATSATAPPTEASEIVGTTGRWVYTLDYGWIWVPNAANLAAVGSLNYVYIYTPNYGWSWYVSPWGPGPYYFGVWAWRAAAGRSFWGNRPAAPDRFARVHHHAGTPTPKGTSRGATRAPSTRKAPATKPTPPSARPPTRPQAPRSPPAHHAPRAPAMPAPLPAGRPGPR